MRYKTLMMAAVISLSAVTATASMMDNPDQMGGMMGKKGRMQMMGEDTRTKLNAPPMMLEHQKQMMREHLRDTQEVISLMAKGDFDAASRTAREKLGLSDRMRKMCSMFGSDQFMEMGLAFHKSADELGEVLKTKDMSKSLEALGAMLDNCVSCHDTFKH